MGSRILLGRQTLPPRKNYLPNGQRPSPTAQSAEDGSYTLSLTTADLTPYRRLQCESNGYGRAATHTTNLCFNCLGKSI